MPSRVPGRSPTLRLTLVLLFLASGARAQQAASAGGGALQGKIMTVTGPIAPAELGITLMHEHLFIDIRFPGRDYSRPPRGISEQERRILRSAGLPVPETAEQIAFWNHSEFSADLIDGLRKGWMTKAWLQITDEGLVRSEVLEFRRAGGDGVVDVTPIGLGRDPEKIRRMARATGLHVVMGTGWYRWPWHSPDVGSRTIESLAGEMVRDITEGVGATGIHAGIIGEVALDTRGMRRGQPPGAYDAEEIKALRAAARASRRTGASITLHSPVALDGSVSFLDTLAAEGADLHRVIVGHACAKFGELKHMKEILARGAYLQCDELGVLNSWTGVEPSIDRSRRVAAGIVAAIGAGYVDQLLVSHDISEPQMLRRYGGSGFTYISDFFLPYLKTLGVTDEEIRTIMVENPRRVLTLVAGRGS